MVKTIKLSGVDVTLRNDIDNYRPRHNRFGKSKNRDVVFAAELDLERIYEELIFDEIRNIGMNHKRLYNTSLVELINDDKLYIKAILEELENLYNKRCELFRQFQDFLSTTEKEVNEEFYDSMIDIYVETQLEFRHKCQMLTNAYAYLHHANLSQIVNISYNPFDECYDKMNEYRDNPECMRLLYAFRKSEYYLLDPIRRDVKTMRTKGLIPLYGVVSTVPLSEDYDYIPSFDLDELFNPYRDTLTLDKLCYLNLSDKLTDEQKTSVVVTMHQLARETTKKKDIFYNIIMAAYCLGIFPDIPEMPDVVEEFKSELQRIVKDKTKELINTKEWNILRNDIREPKYSDPKSEDYDPTARTKQKRHDNYEIIIPSQSSSYYKHFKALKTALENL